MSYTNKHGPEVSEVLDALAYVYACVQRYANLETHLRKLN